MDKKEVSFDNINVWNVFQRVSWERHTVVNPIGSSSHKLPILNDEIDLSMKINDHRR